MMTLIYKPISTVYWVAWRVYNFRREFFLLHSTWTGRRCWSYYSGISLFSSFYVQIVWILYFIAV